MKTQNLKQTILLKFILFAELCSDNQDQVRLYSKFKRTSIPKTAINGTLTDTRLLTTNFSMSQAHAYDGVIYSLD